MLARRVSLLLAVVLVLPITATVVPEAALAAVPACPTAYPVADVVPGLSGTGTSVFDGSGPRTFSARVVGVLEGAVRPGSTLILAQLSGPVIDAAGGMVPFGLSGAPVMVGERLLGVVAWGVTWGPTSLVGLTAGQDVIDLADLEVLTAGAASPDRVTVTAKDGGPAELAPLPLPLQVSGLGAARLPTLQALMERRGLAFRPLQGPSATLATDTTAASVSAGAGFAAVLSTGDITSAAFGAVAYVCEDVVVAFGHPVTYWGSTTFGASLGEPVAVVPDPLYGSTILSRVGASVGSVTDDRWAGIRATVGLAPSAVPVTSTLRSLETGRTRSGRSDVLAASELPWIAQSHVGSNLEIVADRYGAGGADLTFTLRGTADGRAWELERGNRHASTSDIAWEAPNELLGAIAMVRGSGLADVTVTSVAVEGTVQPTVERYTIEEVLVGRGAAGTRLVTLDVAPGDLVPLRVRLRPLPRGTDVVVDLDLRVPPDAPLGFGGLEISGGPGWVPDPYECLWNPDGCTLPDGVETFEQLLAAISDRPRNDDVVARLTVEGGGWEPSTYDGPSVAEDGVLTGPTAEARARVDRVVQGSWLATVNVVPAHFDDVWSSAHGPAIEALAAQGVVAGCAPRRYCPAREVTRGQAASLLSRAFDLRAADPETAPTFADLAPDAPHVATIGALAEAGIVTGFPDGTVRPREPVTRGQLALMLARLLELDTAGEAPFHDVAAGTSVSGAVGALADAGIVRGFADGTFRPGTAITRAEAASLLARALTLLP